MFGLKKKVEVNQLDINEGYRNYVKFPQKIIIICVDEVVDFDKLHIANAQCLPFRLLKNMEDYYPEKDITYYVYAINKALSYKAAKILIQQGYTTYDLGSFTLYHEEEEGMNARKKRRRKK